MSQPVMFHRYQLTSRLGAVRSGALLRVMFDDGQSGVADLHPWPELGDPTLEEFLGDAELRRSHRLFALALAAAGDEAQAQREGRPLLTGSVLNHRLALSADDLAAGDWLDSRRDGAPAMKVKIARAGAASLRAEAATLARAVSFLGPVRLRLDANERAEPDELARFLDQLPVLVRQAIEFIEDPFPLSPSTANTWRDFSRDQGIPLAIDRPLTRLLRREWSDMATDKVFSVFVHKPAWMDEAEPRHAMTLGLPIVVTSTLGHIIGNIWAASRAVVLAPESVHGCLSHTAYRDDEAARALRASKQVRGAHLSGRGVGCGLQGKWLERVKWQVLGGES